MRNIIFVLDKETDKCSRREQHNLLIDQAMPQVVHFHLKHVFASYTSAFVAVSSCSWWGVRKAMMFTIDLGNFFGALTVADDQ